MFVMKHMMNYEPGRCIWCFVFGFYPANYNVK